MEWNDIEDIKPPEGQKVVFYYKESEYSRNWISFHGVYEGNRWKREIQHHDGCLWAMPPVFEKMSDEGAADQKRRLAKEINAQENEVKQQRQELEELKQENKELLSLLLQSREMQHAYKNIAAINAEVIDSLTSNPRR